MCYFYFIEHAKTHTEYKKHTRTQKQINQVVNYTEEKCKNKLHSLLKYANGWKKCVLVLCTRYMVMCIVGLHVDRKLPGSPIRLRFFFAILLHRKNTHTHNTTRLSVYAPLLCRETDKQHPQEFFCSETRFSGWRGGVNSYSSVGRETLTTGILKSSSALKRTKSFLQSVIILLNIYPF